MQLMTNLGVQMGLHWPRSHMQLKNCKYILHSRIVIYRVYCVLHKKLIGCSLDMCFSSECQMVMGVLWTRLTKTDRNWRHVQGTVFFFFLPTFATICSVIQVVFVFFV